MVRSHRRLPMLMSLGLLAGLGWTFGAVTQTAVADVVHAGRMIPAPLPSSRTSTHTGTTQIGSYNWSGYAQSDADGTYTAVTDTWTVPTVNTAVAGDQYSADWVGIGGFSDGTLVQAGTEADNINGVAQYDAWTEVLPAPENVLPKLVVHPGDEIQTTVQLVKKGVWRMTVMDLTTHKQAHRNAHYKGSSEASVEAVHERPCILDGCSTVSDLANLTQTTNVTFDPGEFSTSPGGANLTNPLLVPASGASLYQMFMLANNGTTVIASPSAPDIDNDGFTLADGSVSPPPPSS